MQEASIPVIPYCIVVYWHNTPTYWVKPLPQLMLMGTTSTALKLELLWLLQHLLHCIEWLDYKTNKYHDCVMKVFVPKFHISCDYVCLPCHPKEWEPIIDHYCSIATYLTEVKWGLLSKMTGILKRYCSSNANSNPAIKHTMHVKTPQSELFVWKGMSLGQ